MCNSDDFAQKPTKLCKQMKMYEEAGPKRLRLNCENQLNYLKFFDQEKYKTFLQDSSKWLQNKSNWCFKTTAQLG